MKKWKAAAAAAYQCAKKAILTKIERIAFFQCLTAYVSYKIN